MSGGSVGGRPPFRFSDRFVDQLACPLRTFVRANDGDRDLLAPMLAWSAGPVGIGVTGDNSIASMTGATWLLQVCPDGDWVLYREARGVLTVVPWDDPPDAASETARHVSLAFDQSARVVLAWEDEGSISVRRWNPSLSEYVEDVTFEGVDPVVVFDGMWAYRVPDSDVLLFYLSSDRKKLMCRVQRDVYAVEYELWDFEAATVLDRVLALPWRYQVLLSDSTGSPLPEMLVSDLYPLHLALALAGDGVVQSGAYDKVAEAFAHALAVAGDGIIASGAYVEPFLGIHHDIVLTGDGVIHAANYRSVVQRIDHDINVTGDGEAHAAAYALVGVPVAHDISVTGDAEIIGGTYATP